MLWAHSSPVDSFFGFLKRTNQLVFRLGLNHARYIDNEGVVIWYTSIYTERVIVRVYVHPCYIAGTVPIQWSRQGLNHARYIDKDDLLIRYTNIYMERMIVRVYVHPCYTAGTVPIQWVSCTNSK